MQRDEETFEKPDASFREIDLGCGPNKKNNALGVDCYPYAAVNIVCDLDITPWPIKDSQFDAAHARHVIEHVASIPEFMRETRRVCRDAATVHVVTPHFSSLDSWKDPTHRRHLSVEWYEPFCRPESYLSSQVPGFEVISSSVAFSGSFRKLWPRLLCRLLGTKTWEKHYAFRYPAKNIHTMLCVIK